MKIGYLMQAGVPDIRQYPPSGPSNHVVQVIKELQDLGHDVCLLTVLDGQVWKSVDLSEFTLVSVPRLEWTPIRLFERFVRRFQYELQLPYAALFESLFFAVACCQELSDCDLFYERMGWMGYGAGLAAHWQGMPLVLEVNGDHLSELETLGIAPQGIQRKLSVWLMGRAVRRASHAVATGEGWRHKFIDRWGIDPSRVTVVSNGTGLVDLLKREQLDVFEPETGTSKQIEIVYVGSFEPWHGINVLLQACALAVTHVPLKLTLVGTGPELETVQKQVQEHGLSRHVTFTGQLSMDQVGHELARADIGVAPYCGWSEFDGLKLLDYKAAGLATIASGQNGLPKALEHGRTGWIVPPCDVEALCDAIVRLSRDHTLRRKIGRTARLEAEMCHSWENTARQLDELFQQVIAV